MCWNSLGGGLRLAPSLGSSVWYCGKLSFVSVASYPNQILLLCFLDMQSGGRINRIRSGEKKIEKACIREHG